VLRHLPSNNNNSRIGFSSGKRNIGILIMKEGKQSTMLNEKIQRLAATIGYDLDSMMFRFKNNDANSSRVHT
jgi:hypothetical protein